MEYSVTEIEYLVPAPDGERWFSSGPVEVAEGNEVFFALGQLFIITWGESEGNNELLP